MTPKSILINFIIVLLAGSFAYAEPGNDITGLTSEMPPVECVAIAPAVVKAIIANPPTGKIHLETSPLKMLHSDELVPIDSRTSTVAIPPGDHYAVQFDLRERSMAEFLPENNLNEYCMEAVARAPAWIRNDLIIALNAIGGEWADYTQEAVAEIILGVEEPYVDEVAFTLAHVSPILLENAALFLDLFVENAVGVYEADEYLEYVTIVEHGDFDDGDYWTTLEYNIRISEEEVIQVEIDRDTYYWYVVHPRLSDETPLYIDPSTGSSRQPDTGKFWRDFLLNHPDDGFTSLRDALEGCEVLWSNLQNNGTPENGAVGRVTGWIRHVLDFTSGQERPIQPVRIYRMHMGRCGEHSDMTAAAGRAALIPTLCTSTMCTDHTWNEFWGGDRWVVWEPVNNYVDSAPYDNWNEIPAAINWRSDASVWTVTDRYSPTSDLTITIMDFYRKPVDGARIGLASGRYDNPDHLSWCTWGYTDSEGEVSFKIGDNKAFYVQIKSELGNYPGDGVTQIIGNSEADREYTWSYRFNGRMPNVSPTEREPSEDPRNQFHVTVEGEMLNDIARGMIFQDAEFFLGVGTGELDFFICDAEAYERYLDGNRFAALNMETLTEAGEFDVILPTNEIWYAVFSNANRVANYMEARITTTLKIDTEVGIADTAPVTPVAYSLYQNYPNPFNAITHVPFDLKASGETTVSILDLTGRRLQILPVGNLPSGRHEVSLNMNKLSSGSYFYEIQCNDFVERKSMMLLK